MTWPGVEIRESSDGGRRFVLSEPELTCICVNFQTRFKFGEAELVIETPFSLSLADAHHDFDPNERLGLGQVLALYPDTLDQMTMTPDGTLTTLFVSGARLTVPPHPRYEAWSVGGFYCVPGGFE